MAVPSNKKGYIFNVGGVERKVYEDKLNEKGGIDYYRQKYPDASVKMVDADSNEYDIPINEYNDAVIDGLALYQYDVSPMDKYSKYQTKKAAVKPVAEAPATPVAPVVPLDNANAHAPVVDENLNVVSVPAAPSAEEVVTESRLAPTPESVKAKEKEVPQTPFVKTNAEADLAGVREIMARNEAVNKAYGDANKNMLNYAQGNMLGAKKAVENGITWDDEKKEFAKQYTDVSGNIGTKEITEFSTRNTLPNVGAVEHFENPEAEVDRRITEVDRRLQEYTTKKNEAKKVKKDDRSWFVKMVDAMKDTHSRHNSEVAMQELGNDLQDEEFKNLLVQKIMLKQAKNRFGGNKLAKGDGFWDVQNWTNIKAGIGDALDNPETLGGATFTPVVGLQLAAISDKWEKGEALTEDEKNVAIAGALLQEAQSGDAPLGYTTGEMTGMMLPFIAEIALNPGRGIGSGLAKVIAMPAIRKFGLTGAKRIATKAGARIVGDVAQASALAGTMQSAKVLGEAGKRRTGQADYTINAEGVAVPTSFENREGYLEALGKSFGTMAIENYTELLGEQFGVIGTGAWKYAKQNVGKAGEVLTKVGNKVGDAVDAVFEGEDALNHLVDNVAETLESAGRAAGVYGRKAKKKLTDVGHLLRLDQIGTFIRSNGAKSWWNATKKLESNIQLSGIGSELLEEEAAIVLNAALVGDEKFENLYDLEHQKQLLAGVAFMSGSMAGVRTAKFAVDYRNVSKSYNKANLNATAKLGVEWDAVRQRIDVADDTMLAKELTEITSSDKYTNEQKQAIEDYAFALERYRGYNFTSDIKVRKDAYNTLYQQGYDAEGDVRRQVVQEWQKAKISADAVFNGDADAMLATYDKEGLELEKAIAGDKAIAKADRVALITYARAKYRYNAMNQRINDDIDNDLSELSKDIDAITNKNTGTIIQVKKKGDDKVYYANSGALSYDLRDGKVNPAKSSTMVVLYDAETGKATPVSKYDLDVVMASENAEKYKEKEFGELKAQKRAEADAQLREWASSVRSEELGVRSDDSSVTDTTEDPKVNDTENAPVMSVEDVVNRVGEWNAKTGKKVRVLTSIDEVTNQDAINAINNGKVVRGWYETSTNEVVIYAPNMTSANEVDEVYIHEVVAHDGIRGLFGQKGADIFFDRVYAIMSEADRARYENYPGIAGITDAQARQRAIADEYIAHLAEKEFDAMSAEEQSLWNEIVEFVKEMLEKMLGNTELTHEDISKALQMSYAKMRRDASLDASSTERQNNITAEESADVVEDDNADASSTERQKDITAEESAEESAIAPIYEVVAPAETRRGTDADIEDVIAIYAEGDAGKAAEFRRIPNQYDDAIAELQDDLDMAIAWANNEPASEKPLWWDYWKEREGLEEPSVSADTDAPIERRKDISADANPVEALKEIKKASTRGKKTKDSRQNSLKREIEDKLATEWSDVPSEVRSIIESLTSLDEPIDIEDVVYSALEDLASPKAAHKLLLQSDGVLKGVTAELGLPPVELQNMLGRNRFAKRENGGISLQRFAHNIWENLVGENLPGASEVTDADIRDMLIEAIRSTLKPGDISNHRVNRRMEIARKHYEDWKRNEEALEAKYARDVEAEHAAEELWLIAQQNAHELMELNHLDNIFADELAERERVINEQNRISNERINERGLGSNRLLRSQQTDTSGRVEEGSERQGIQEEVGDVVSRIQDAETQGRQANSVAEREIRAEEVDFGKERTRLNTRLEEIDSRLTDTRVVDQLQADVDKAIAIYGGAENIPKELYSDLLSRSNAIREETQEFYREKYEIEEQLRVLDKNEKTAIKEAEREAKLAEIEKKYSGFLSGKSRVEQGRVDKVLSKPIRYNGVAMTKGQMIEALIDEGVRFEPSSINGKKIYIARTDDNSYHEITKTEYEYARHLGGKTLTQEEAAKAEQKLRYETLRKKYPGLISVKGDLDRRIAWLERALKGGNPNNTAGKKMQAELAELRELKDLSEGEARFSVEEEDENLVGLHNLTEANLAHAAKMGGLANPSMAVMNRDIATLDNFGDITLIASKALIDKKSGKNAGTWGADAYSPRYPRVEHQLSDKASKELRERGEQAGLEPHDISYLEQEIESNGKRYLVGDRKIQKLYDAEGKNGESISEYVDRFYDGLEITERLFKGYTWDGRRRYAKHTLENVSRMMKAEGRAGAEGNFGMGSVRATLTPIFKNIAQIKKAKGRIVSHEEFEKAKESLESRFYELINLVSTSKFDFAAADRLGEAMLSRNPKEYLEQEYGIEISDEDSQKIKTLAADLSVMPTEYFETKFERPVMLEEFAKAVIPNDATAKTRQILADAGLEVVEYDPNVKGDRLRAVREASERDGVRFSVKDGDKKTSISERSDAVSDNSSSNGLLRGGKEHLSHIALTTPEDVAKLQKNSQNTINSARKQLNAGGFNNLTTPENAVRELGKKLKLEKSLSSQSYYGEFYEGDFLVGGRKLNLRVSTHPASGHRIGNSDADDKVSIVIYKNGEHYSKEEHAGYVEYIYDEKDVSLNDTANAVLKGVINLIENGEYIDETQKAKFQEYPYVDENGNTRFRIGDVDKDEQLRIIQETNPAPNDVNTWVRSVDDIKTFEEALKDSDYAPYAGEDFDDSYTWDIVEDALRSGEIEVYSSKPIVNGVFVTPSRMEAESYGDGNVYRARVQLSDVAWIDPTQGQLATNNEVDYKRKKGQFRFSVGDNAETREMNSKQKAVGKVYPTDMDFAMTSIEGDGIRFAVTKRQKETIMSKRWLGLREDLTEVEKESFVAWLDEQDYTPAMTLATARWFANGTIRVPEDMPKVEQAMKVAEIAKVDATTFVSPLALVEQFADIKPKEKAINPDEVSTLSNKMEYGNGIVVYDVEESQESRENMRKIINTHFGEDSNPWCLLQGDGNGNLTKESAQYWKHYNAYPKRVAFRNGKLIAFFASDYEPTWWDKQDGAHEGIPYTYKEDDWNIEAEYSELDDTSIIRSKRGGSKQNGIYEEYIWHRNGKLVYHAEYKDGELNGLEESWYENGTLESRAEYKDGKLDGLWEFWHENGQPRSRAGYKDHELNGLKESWYENGTLESRAEHKDDKLNGLKESWYENGTLESRAEYKDDKLNGLKETWYEDGTLKSRAEYKDGELNGLEESWYENGTLESRAEYKDGKKDGKKEEYFSSGRLARYTEFKNGKNDGLDITYYPDGRMEYRAEFKEGWRNGSLEQWDFRGDLIYSAEYKGGREISRTGKTFFSVGANADTKGEGDWLVSNAERAVRGIKQEKATPEQWLKMIEKGGGLKAGEDKWIGLSDWLKASDAKTLTKKDVLDYINTNRIKVEEVKYGDWGKTDVEGFVNQMQEEYQDVYDEVYDESEQFLHNAEKAYYELAERYGLEEFINAFDYKRDGVEIYVRDEESLYKLMGESINPIHHMRQGYTTEGLTNKREVALVVPTIESWEQGDEIHFGDAGNGRAVAWARFGETTERAKEWNDVDDYLSEMRSKYNAKEGEETDYMTKDEIKNLQSLTARAIDAKAPRVLVIDEIQSKRHQEGREKGYQKMTQKEYEQEQERLREKRDQFLNERRIFERAMVEKYATYFWDDLATAEEQAKLREHTQKITDAEGELDALIYSRRTEGTTPAAPFEKNWQELAMKRMLRLAAEEGFDKLAWTSGEQQAKRYALSRQISNIDVLHTGDKYWVDVYDLEGDKIDQVSGGKTPEEITEVFGKDLGNRILAVKGRESIKGDGLEVGGEGMKTFYDKMIPSFMNKYVKKWGTKVDVVELPNLEEDARQMWSVDITPEMKRDVMEGQTMFSVRGEYAPVWRDGESFSEAEDRLKRQKNILSMQIARDKRKQAMGRAVDADAIANAEAELEEVKRQALYLEIGPELPVPAEGEEVGSESFSRRMEAYEEALNEWRSKRWGEDSVLDSLLRDASATYADMSDEEFAKYVAEEAEKNNVSVKEMKALVREQIRERRRSIETNNWRDEVFIHDIKNRTTEEQRKAIPHILEGSHAMPVDRKDSRYKRYLYETGKVDVSAEIWEDRETLLVDAKNVDNRTITRNQHGLRQSDVVEYAIDEGATIYIHPALSGGFIRFANGDVFTLDKYGVEYASFLQPDIWLNHMGKDDMELMGMFMRGEAKEYPPKGLREYVENKEYDQETLDVAREVRAWFEDAWALLELEGMTYKKEAIEDYVTHIWDLKNSTPTAITTMQKFIAATAPKALKDINNYVATNTPYMKTRAITSLKDGMALGLVPKYEDITDIIRDYGHRLNESVANRRLVNFVKGLEVNGMPAIREEGSKVGVGLYKPIKNNALKGYEVHTDVKPVLDVIFGEYHSADNEYLQKAGKLYDMWGGLMKKINLSLSFFHHWALTESAISMMGFPRAMKVVFKNILWDAGVKGHLPAFNDEELTADAVKHFVQLGATSDYSAKEVQMITEKLARWAKGKAGLEQAANFADWVNKGMDKVLWDYLHDGLKIYSYGKIAGELKAKAKAEGWSEEKLNKCLDEAGQLINDTFGGQHWDMMNMSPNALKWARRLLLSPDWTLSSLRQALAPFGFNSIYNDNKVWKKLSKDDADVASVRKKYGRSFWLTAGLFFGIVMNAMNAYFRMKDEDEEKEKADEMRKTNPDYKSPYEILYPDGMKWWEYTMFGNTQGHQTHLFMGRYADGKESYLRWGKQFRELPELFYGRDGLGFPDPMIEKIAGKMNPVFNVMSNFFSGKSLTGFENPFMRDTKGMERNIGRIQVLVAAHMPYSIPTDEEKEFKLIDLVMPSTKGFSSWKAIDRFKAGLKDGDLDFVREVIRACVKNGIDPEETMQAAMKQIEAEVKDAMMEGVEDLQDALSQYDEEKNPMRRMQLKNFARKHMSMQVWKEVDVDALLETAETMINNGVSGKDINRYEMLATSRDLQEDWRIDYDIQQLRKYEKEMKEIKAQGDSLAMAMFQRDKGAYIDKLDHLCKVREAVTKMKGKLNKGNDAEVMAQTREIRNEAFNPSRERVPKAMKKMKTKKEESVEQIKRGIYK